jgi:outer membrane lipoprotein-sorting protein
MIAKLHSLKTYQVTIQDTTVLDSGAGTKPRTLNSTGQIKYVKPNLIDAELTGVLGGGKLVSDGKTEYTYSELANQYSTQPAPADYTRGLLGGTSGKGVAWTLAGTSTVGAIPVTDMTGLLSTPQGKATVTLSVGRKDFLPYKIVSVLPKFTSPRGGTLQVTRTQTFSDIKTNRSIALSAFKFTPPSDATKASSPGQLAGGLGFGGDAGQ